MQEFENNTSGQSAESRPTWFSQAPGVIGGEVDQFVPVQPAAAPVAEAPAVNEAAVYTEPAYAPVPAEAAAPQFVPVQDPAPQVAPVEEVAPQFVPVQEAVPQFAPVQQAAPQPVPAQPVPKVSKAPKAPRKKGGKVFGRIVAAVLVVAMIAGSGVATMYLMGRELKKRDESHQAQLAALEKRLEEAEKKSGTVINAVTMPAGQTSVSGDLLTPAQVYAANLNSVVLINNVVSNGLYTSGGTGSGFILTESGYVVTNHHVIEGGGKLSVVTADGTEYPAQLIGSDNANDVALLKIEAEGLQAVVLGDSDVLTVGDQVAAIGNPLGELTSTLTVGYVSAKERDVNTSGFAINMLQTDAAINSGNSGGPLFNMYGHVVGITTAKYSGSSSSGATIEGIGFAIPINDVRGMLEDLVEHGYVVSPYLGVSVSDMDSESAAYYGLPMGAYVNSVEEGFCAQKAGVLAKDIIIKVGDYEVDSVNSLSRALRNYKAGDTIVLVVSRSGAEKKLTVTLDEKPREESGQTEDQENNENNSFGQLIPGRG